MKEVSSQFSVSVVILNWNGKEFLRECLESLKKQNVSDNEIIVVDNGSTDGSVSWLKECCPEVIIIENRENLGFAKGNNSGFKVAKGKFILVLNNDTVLEVKFIEELLKVAESEERIGMVAPKILNYNNHHMIDSAGIKIYLDGMSRGRRRGEKDYGKFEMPEEILLPSACSALYKREMIEEVGGFDEDFFSYCEDTDFGLHARLLGWKAMFAPKALVYHRYSSTAGRYSPLKAYLVERNHIWVAIKNFPFILLMFLPIFTLCRYILSVLGVIFKRGAVGKFCSEKKGKRELLGILFKANFDAIRKISLFLSKRRKIRMSRKIKDRDFLCLIKKHYLSVFELVFRE